MDALLNSKEASRKHREAMLCGIDEHDDAIRERDTLKAVLQDLMEERGIPPLEAFAKHMANMLGQMKKTLEALQHERLRTQNYEDYHLLHRCVLYVDVTLDYAQKNARYFHSLSSPSPLPPPAEPEDSGTEGDSRANERKFYSAVPGTAGGTTETAGRPVDSGPAPAAGETPDGSPGPKG